MFFILRPYRAFPFCIFYRKGFAFSFGIASLPPGQAGFQGDLTADLVT
jgi:hypothetical protein